MSKKQYLIVCQEPCQTCNGAGVVANPLWVRLYAEERQGGKEIDENEWARANGFDSAKAMGPEEHQCQDCEGEGKLTSQVSLADALVDLGVMAVAD